MPIPEKKAGENTNDFVSRCIAAIYDEYEMPQSAAICYSKARESMSDEFKYDWDKCISDQLKQYGSEETAEKVCGAIKAANMSSEEFKTLPTQDCEERHRSAGYTEQYIKWACSSKMNDNLDVEIADIKEQEEAQQSGVVNTAFARTKFEYPPQAKEKMSEFMGRCMADAMVRERKKDRIGRAHFCYSEYQNRYVMTIGKNWK